MTKFPNAANADFRKIVRILTSMMKNAGAKVESNWSVEVLRKRGASTFTYTVYLLWNNYDVLGCCVLIQLSVLQQSQVCVVHTRSTIYQNFY